MTVPIVSCHFTRAHGVIFWVFHAHSLALTFDIWFGFVWRKILNGENSYFTKNEESFKTSTANFHFFYVPCVCLCVCYVEWVSSSQLPSTSTSSLKLKITFQLEFRKWNACMTKIFHVMFLLVTQNNVILRWLEDSSRVITFFALSEFSESFIYLRLRHKNMVRLTKIPIARFHDTTIEQREIKTKKKLLSSVC